MQIGLQIADFTWPGGPARLGADLAKIARTADEGGFEFVTVMDHFFQIPVVGPVEHDMLEAYTALGFLAAHTERAKLLTLVTGASYRHPGVLGKIISTLDVLSGGRAWLGIGAGWNEDEAAGLGIPFPPAAERFERLEETVQICLRMWAGDENPFVGRHFRLQRPLNVPRPLTRPHPPIMIGGDGLRKTLRLVARYAQACNVSPGPDLAHKLEVLREHCARVGRSYDSIRKTATYAIDVGVDGQNVGKVLEDLHGLAQLGIQATLGPVRDVWRIRPLEIVAEQVIPQAREFKADR